MTQQRISPLKYHGPFYGLNTTLDPAEIPPGFAIEARDVIMSEGRIRPRPPLQRYGDPLSSANSAYRFIPRSLFQYKTKTSLGGSFPSITLAKVVAHEMATAVEFGALLLYKFNPDQPAGTPFSKWLRIFGDGVNQLMSREPATCVPYGDYIYVVDGSERTIKIHEGTGEAHYVGIDHPVGDEFSIVVQSITVGQRPIEQADLKLALTWYDSTTGTESNPFVPLPTYTPTANALIHLIIFNTPNLGPEKYDTLRVYRKNLTKGEIGYRLNGEFPAIVGSDVYVQYTDDELDELGISTPETGPFAPSLNMFPPVASVASLFRGRMFYGHHQSDKVFFSAVGQPDHVDRSSLTGAFEDFSGGGFGVTGMKELAGVLVVSKPKTLHILAGVISHITNDEVATGQPAPDSSHEVYRGKCSVGSANTTGGNGLIVCGEPEYVYFGNETGFYRFDGANAMQVNNLIQPLWEDFCRIAGTAELAVGTQEMNQRLCYAIDPKDKIIYIGQAREDFAVPVIADEFILAFGYGLHARDGVERWTKITMAELGGFVPKCIGSVYAESVRHDTQFNIYIIAEHTGSFLVGVRDMNHEGQFEPGDDAVYLCSDRYPANPMPRWKWNSGVTRITHEQAKHFYQFKLLHNRLSEAVAYTSAPEVNIMVRLPQVTKSFVRSLRNRVRQLVRLWVTADEFQWEVGAGDNWLSGWDRSIGVVGYEVQAELVGQW